MGRSGRRAVEDFAAVVRGISRQSKDPMVLVGGHAVNVWAMAYREQLGSRIETHLPLTSADLDLVATRNALIMLHREVGGRLQLSGPREVTEGTLIVGAEPDALEIDVLRIRNGVPRVAAPDTVDLEVCGYVISVLFPHLLLQGKLANALEIDQRDRQDVKHVRVLALVLREFLAGLVSSATPSNERAALGLLQEVLKILTSERARRFASKHRHSFREVMPHDLLAASELPRLRRFGQHQVARADIP